MKSNSGEHNYSMEKKNLLNNQICADKKPPPVLLPSTPAEAAIGTRRAPRPMGRG